MTAGFVIKRDLNTKTIFLRFWDIWSPEDCMLMEKSFREAVDFFYNNQSTFYVLADLTEYPAQSYFVNSKLKENMVYAVDHGLVRSARVFSSILNKKQIRRISRKVNPVRFNEFISKQDALAWLYQ